MKMLKVTKFLNIILTTAEKNNQNFVLRSTLTPRYEQG